LRFDPNPSYPRVVVIGILIFLEAVLINVYAVLSMGRWPTDIELAGFLTAGLMQLVTYWLGFLRKQGEKTKRR